MVGIDRFNKLALLSAGLILLLSCTLIGAPEPNPSLVETEIALRVISTGLANDRLTMQAVQTAQAGQQPPLVQPTPATPTQLPTQPPSPEPTETPRSTELISAVELSVDTFYCYQPPYELTITVRVTDIDRGLAVYYHIEDKSTGVRSDNQVLDLHRTSSNTRSATVIGGFSAEQNLQFPPLMGESYFIYQIISDDGQYRSPAFSDVTFFPCAQ
jgi:hypothetical protein